MKIYLQGNKRPDTTFVIINTTKEYRIVSTTFKDFVNFSKRDIEYDGE